MRALKGLGEKVVSSGAWKKLVNPTAARGQTQWPKSPADLEAIGVRFDYDGQVNIDGVLHNKFQCQPNAGKIPSSVKDWREENGGTHAVMASIYIKADSSKEEVQSAIEDALSKV